MHQPLSVAVIGAGYWGPNLARNFAASPHWRLDSVCDLDHDRAAALVARTGGRVRTVDEVLDDPTVDALAIATPARTHHPLAMAALAAGKHVVVEKPLADTVEHGREMVDEAALRGLVLMADHTYCYTPAVAKIKQLIADGSLGDVLFIDSTRINLGLIQPDVDVFWDLAPHDLAIIDFVLPGGIRSEGAVAQGFDPLGAGRSCVGYLTLPAANGTFAHVHVNWLSPTKIRTMVIGGSRRTLVWDDLNPQQRIVVYDRGVDLAAQSVAGSDRSVSTVSYRLGDAWSPALAETEPLSAMVAEFASAIVERRAPVTDGVSALRVLEVLEATGSRADERVAVLS